MKTWADAPYHAGARYRQDRFDSCLLADRLAERLARCAIGDDDRTFIQRQPMFFLATADERGQPDVSYKGSAPGFVRILDERTLAFPSYDGNGMFRSLGNVWMNSRVPPAECIAVQPAWEQAVI